MEITQRRNPSKARAPQAERRAHTERRRDHVTRAKVSSRMIALHAEKLPEGPERHAALAALIRLTKEVADAHERQHEEERNAMRSEIRDLAVGLSEHAQHGHQAAVSDSTAGIISNPLILPAIVVTAVVGVIALFLTY